MFITSDIVLRLDSFLAYYIEARTFFDEIWIQVRFDLSSKPNYFTNKIGNILFFYSYLTYSNYATLIKKIKNKTTLS